MELITNISVHAEATMFVLAISSGILFPDRPQNFREVFLFLEYPDYSLTGKTSYFSRFSVPEGTLHLPQVRITNSTFHQNPRNIAVV